MSQTTMGKWERDPVSREPAIVGSHGRAWEVQWRTALLAKGVDPEADNTIAGWLIEAPWAHPFWHSYYLACVYLRVNPIRGPLPTHWHLEGATHEMWLWALDPDQPREPAVEAGALRILNPMNFAAQFIEPDDEAAAKRIREAVVDVCAGWLSPDTDFKRVWAARFGGNMLL